MKPERFSEVFMEPGPLNFPFLFPLFLFFLQLIPDDG